MARILLIDDDEGLRFVMAEGLRSAGHEVTEAADGNEGLRLYHAEPPELVITDIVMPDMDGLVLIEKLRVTIPRPHIIAMSGHTKYSEPLYLPTARLLGAQRTLGKPFKLETLLAAVTAELADPLPATVLPRPPA